MLSITYWKFRKPCGSQEKISSMNLKKAYNDASFFLENKEDKRLFSKDLLIQLAGKIKTSATDS